MSDKKINAGKPAKKFTLSKKTKIGTYTFIITLVLLAVLVVINLLIAALPKSITLLDTSTNKLYTISEGSEDFITGVEESVVINWVCQNGVEDPMLKTFIEKYTGINKKLSLNILDPIKDPTCLDKYIGEADSAPSNYSLIIESAKRFRVINYETLYYYYNAMLDSQYGISEPAPYEFYEYYYQYFYSAESSGSPTETFFYGDDKITKAVEYVTLEKIPHVYIIEGHGEAEFSASLLKLISDNNIEYETLKLATVELIPQDASTIVIYSPNTDLSSSETQIIKEYLDIGGNMLLITSLEHTGMNNLLSLVEPYGVSAVPGMVYDESTSHYKSNQYTLVPDVNVNHNVTAAASQYTMIMPKSHGIKVNESAATVSELFTTSGSAYSLVGETKSESGSLALGVAIENVTEGGTSQIIWYSSADAFTDATASASSYGNYYYMFYSLYWMNETYESSLSDVIGVPTTEPLLDGLTSTSIILWASVFAGVIPLTVIISGLVVWLKRRKR